MRTKRKIKKEMKELYPRKELAYMDAKENQSDRLWDDFRSLRDQWNILVDEYEGS